MMQFGSFVISFPSISPMNRRDKIFKLVVGFIVLREKRISGIVLSLQTLSQAGNHEAVFH